MNDRLRLRSNARQRGYIMVATALSLPMLLGVCGLAIDIGRMYITKNEAQAFADSASLSAARQSFPFLSQTTKGCSALSA